MTDAVFSGFDVDALMQVANAQPVGQQKAKYSADVAAALGANPIFEIYVSGAVYRSTVNGMLVGNSAGIVIPSQFVEPPSINIANALTASSAVVNLRNANNTAVKITIPVKAGGGGGFLTASKALDGTEVVRTSGFFLSPPTTLDINPGGGGGGGGDAGLLQTALREAMVNPPGREGRCVHSVNSTWSQGYPQPTYIPEAYTVQCFPNQFYGAGNTQLLPWLVAWDEATSAFGQPHITNPSNRKVAMHVRDWYTLAHYSDNNQWVVHGPHQITGVIEQYDGRFGANSNQPAGDFPPEQRVTFSDGTKGVRMINESGITQPSQVRMQHSWSSFYQIPSSRHAYIDAIVSAFKARLEPVSTTASGANVGGTATDVTNARILCWTGIDHYPINYAKPDIEASMQGRPKFLTADYRWHSSWVKLPPDGVSQSWLDSRPVPSIS